MNTGAVLSCTVITCEAVFVLLQSSVAIHVRVKVYLFGQLPLVRTSVKETATIATQLSEAVGVPADGILLHDTVALAGTNVNVGAWVSFSEKRESAFDIFPHSSVAMKVTPTDQLQRLAWTVGGVGDAPVLPFTSVQV